jgi:disulfide bond formation protein DsbB
METSQSKLGWVQFGIMITAVITAVVHLYIGFTLPSTLFIMNGIGYLVLLIGLFVQFSLAQKNRSLIRWVLMASAVTIVAWQRLAISLAPEHWAMSLNSTKLSCWLPVDGSSRS